MDKSIHSHEYAAALKLLREIRENAGISQIELAAKIGETQTFVSKCERGERRVDLIELRTFCTALGVPLRQFVDRLEKALRRKHSQNAGTRSRWHPVRD
jgi:transcriptional regulator with XRE-family HTH domain